MSVTSIRLEDNLEKELQAVCTEMRRSKGWLINEALRIYLENKKLEQTRWQETVEALEDIRLGRIMEGDKVNAWLASWGTDKELESPAK